MSKYYQVKGLKVRISDHEPNTRLNGSSDINLYIKSACNELLSIESQVEAICEKKGYNLIDFKEVIDEWKDGTYTINELSSKTEETEDECNECITFDLITKKRDEDTNRLKGFYLDRFASHSDIKQLSAETGVSQSFIKKYFNIR